MIEIYTGVPGSGKTYRAVSYLYDIFIDSKSKSFGKFQKFYTNINEFKFEEFPAGVGYDLDFEELLTKLKTLHALYMKKCTDSELIELAKTLDLDNAFFIIDEAHNYFEKKNTVLTWWLSYHRHLHQDIILITQNLALIESKYKSFSEFFYKAIPSSLRIFGSTLKYEQYIGSRMFKNQRSDKFSLKFNPDVFELYHSGANTQSKKVIYKYVTFAVLGLSAFLIFGYAVVYFMFGGDNKNPPTVSPPASSVSPQNKKITPIAESIKNDDSTMRFICDFETCAYNGQIFSINEMSVFIKEYPLKVVKFQSIDDTFFIYHYEKNDKFLKEHQSD